MDPEGIISRNRTICNSAVNVEYLVQVLPVCFKIVVICEKLLKPSTK